MTSTRGIITVAAASATIGVIVGRSRLDQAMDWLAGWLTRRIVATRRPSERWPT